MLPDMSDALADWERSVLHGTVTQSVVDHRVVKTYVDSTIKAVVQPADKERLNIDVVDWSKKYILLHTKVALGMGDKISVDNATYAIISASDYSKYGYYESVGEEIK